ncbi:cation:proton antiporter [Herbaspirillum rhizosphaerae]|uniref:cation:proton antiporter n=1 Tax=Herbaspirillum rhizosphaerae TaxID=346179 RepID=UPI001F0A501D|nr:cation:proton antiporter [Herbaspirillum rhizosphaerae]
MSSISDVRAASPYLPETLIDIPTVYFLIAGVLLTFMVFLESVLERLPFNAAMLYLPIGWLLGSSGVGLIHIDLRAHADVLTVITRVALLLSLFTVGLKLRVAFRGEGSRLWWLPLRLGVLSMLITVPLLAISISFLFGMPFAVAMLLSAILAPTDPVLASDVQVKNVDDPDQLRFSLSGEGGLNDGSAFPFVILALILLGVTDEIAQVHHFGWFVAWGVAAGIGCGALFGWAMSRLVLFARQRFGLALGMEEFMAIGIIMLSYGVAELVHGIGFLSVFAAGLAMRQVESASSGNKPAGELIAAAEDSGKSAAAVHPEQAPVYLTETVLGFNQQLEHFAEFFMVLLMGILLSEFGISGEGVLIAGLLFFVIRPIAVGLGLLGSDTETSHRWLIAWFGIRGVGSLYYLCFVLQFWHDKLNVRIAQDVLTVLALSVLLHGMSSAPLMHLYWRKRAKSGR